MTDNQLHYRRLLADRTVTHWCKWATLASFVPVSTLDVLAIAGTQAKMIHSLCKIYNVPFEKEAVSSILSSFAGGGIAALLGGSVAGSFVGKIPLVGKPLLVASYPLFAYAATYAIGAVFIAHFEKRGTVEDLSTEAFRDFYNQRLLHAKSIFKRTKIKTS